MINKGSDYYTVKGAKFNDTIKIAETCYHLAENLGIHYGDAETAEQSLLMAYDLLNDFGKDFKGIG